MWPWNVTTTTSWWRSSAGNTGFHASALAVNPWSRSSGSPFPAR